MKTKHFTGKSQINEQRHLAKLQTLESNDTIEVLGFKDEHNLTSVKKDNTNVVETPSVVLAHDYDYDYYYDYYYYYYYYYTHLTASARTT